MKFGERISRTLTGLREQLYIAAEEYEIERAQKSNQKLENCNIHIPT
jgi:hypothetical protein